MDVPVRPDKSAVVLRCDAQLGAPFLHPTQN